MTIPTAPMLAELRHGEHRLREPLGGFFINVELLESTQLATEGRSYIKTLKG